MAQDLHGKAEGKRLTRVLGLDPNTMRLLLSTPTEETEKSQPSTESQSEQEAKDDKGDSPVSGEELPKAMEQKRVEAEKDEEDLAAQFKSFLKESNTTYERSFLTVFLDEPGKSAKALGPQGVEAAIGAVDKDIGKMVEAAREEGLEGAINWVVVSTPGYADVDMSKVINLKQYVSKDFEATGSSPVLNIKASGSQGKSLGRN